MISRGWASWLNTSGDLWCLILMLSLLAGCAACETMRGMPILPPCPTPTMAMVEEATQGALDDAPATLFYLAQLENYCDGIQAIR